MAQNIISKLSANQVCIYGIHPSISAINNPCRNIYKIICNKKVLNTLEKSIIDFKSISSKIKIVENNFFHSLDKDTLHQGVMVIASKLPMLSMDDFLLQSKYFDDMTIVILDEVKDPRNIGAIIRSCVAFNVSAILFVKHHSPSETSSMIKASAGAIENIKLIQVTNLSMAIKTLKDTGFWIVGLDAHTDSYINNVDIPQKKAIVLGEEGKGLRKLTKESCDFLVKIPIANKIESLNISNAAAIVLYSLQKTETAKS